MKNVNLNYRSDSYRRVFSKKNKKVKTPITLSIESFILFISGTAILYFVSTVPSDINLPMTISEAWDNLVIGFQRLFDSLITLGIGLSLIGLSLLGLLLILGGIFRFIKILTLLSHKNTISSKRIK